MTDSRAKTTQSRGPTDEIICSSLSVFALVSVVHSTAGATLCTLHFNDEWLQTLTDGRA